MLYLISPQGGQLFGCDVGVAHDTVAGIRPKRECRMVASIVDDNAAVVKKSIICRRILPSLINFGGNLDPIALLCVECRDSPSEASSAVTVAGSGCPLNRRLSHPG